MTSHKLHSSLLAAVLILGCAEAQIVITPPSTGTGGGGGGTPADTVAAPTTYGASANPGSASTYSRGDHTHGTPAVPSATDVGAVPSAGNATITGVKTFSSSPIVPTPTTGTQVANKAYVDAFVNGLSWKDPVLNATLSTDDGLTPTTGDRYIVNGTGADGWAGQDNAFAEYTDVWVFTDAEEGDAVMDLANTKQYVFNGTAWVQANASEAYTASDGVEKIGNDFRADLKANGGLALDGNELKVDYDNSTIGITGGKLAVKTGSLTESYLSGVLDDAGRVSGAALVSLNATPTTTKLPAGCLGTGTTDATTYLGGDGLWKTASMGVGTGTVTEIVTLRAIIGTGTGINAAQTGTVFAGGNYMQAVRVDLSNGTHFRLRLSHGKSSTGAPNVTFRVYYSTATFPPSSLASWTKLETGAEIAGDVTNNYTTTSVIPLVGNSVEIAAGAKTAVWLSLWGFSATSTASNGQFFHAFVEVLQGAGNATTLQGRALAATAPSDGQAIVWDNANSTWKPGSAGDTLPTQTGHNGEYLTTNGTTTSWETPSAGLGGSSGSVDNAVLRANGTGGSTAQSSSINISDASTSTQNNVQLAVAHDGQTNSNLVLSPMGSGALMTGAVPDGGVDGGNARGTYATDWQRVRSVQGQVASGNSSVIAGGANNTSSAVQTAVGGGYSNVASGNQAAIAGGYSNTASGGNSAIAGGGYGTASGGYSMIPGGLEAKADLYGHFAHGSGCFAAVGDCQVNTLIWRGGTANNSTPVELFLDGSSHKAVLTAERTWAGILTITARQDNGTSCFWQYQVGIERTADATALVGTPTLIGTAQGSTSLDSSTISITADDTTEYLKITVTCESASGTRWMASYKFDQLGY